MKNKLLTLWAIASLLLMLDVVLTLHGISHGGKEANPLVKQLVARPFLAIAWRFMGIYALWLFASATSEHPHYARNVSIMLWGCIVLFSLVDAWGFYQLLGQHGVSECDVIAAWNAKCDPTLQHW